MLALLLLALPPGGSVRKITWRLKAESEVATPDQIVDGQFVPIGSREPHTAITEDSKNTHLGRPVYHFSCDGQANRIELTTAFASADNLKGYTDKQIKLLTDIHDGYINSLHGNYGDTMVYDWYTKFPDAPSADKGGIFAQWHARPDRTTMINANGQVQTLTLDQMGAVLDTMYFDGRIGKNKASNQPNGWRVDASDGGPIADMQYRPPFMYMEVRSDAERVSDNDVKIKSRPGRSNIGVETGRNGKTGFLAFSMPTDQVPVDTWIHFRVEIKYSKYNPAADEALDKGYIKVWMDGKPLCDIRDVHIGKNDALGPFFKYGIYKPSPGGFSVEDCGFTETHFSYTRQQK